ncbi:uncharacterized protein [Amphiura filiformis]|uniref:uncharacterized protein n=1 Tax=Amphiura filiformis TaxID=82378 RepID=UPI003B224BD4
MKWQKRISVIAPFVLGMMHLLVQANGIQSSLKHLMLPSIEQVTTDLPIMTPDEDGVQSQQGGNSAFVDPKNMLLDNTETWYAFDALQNRDRSGPDLNGHSTDSTHKDMSQDTDAVFVNRSINPDLLDIINNNLTEHKGRFRKDLDQINPTDDTNSGDDEDRLGLSTTAYQKIRDLLKTAGVDLRMKGVNSTKTVDPLEDPDEKQVDDDVGVRQERSFDCPQSPPGVPYKCFPCASDRQDTFDHTDEYGNTCACDMCMAPTYMTSPCTCTPDGQVAPDGQPTCIFPEEGQTFMPFQNYCPIPFDCQPCSGDLVTTSPCTVGEDTKCGCPDGTDQTGETSCIPSPLCMQNEGSVRVHKPGDRYPSHVCEPCAEGYIQSKNNTLDKCHLPVIDEEKESDNDDGDKSKEDQKYATTSESETNATLSSTQATSRLCDTTTHTTNHATTVAVSTTKRCIHPILATSMGIFILGVGVVIGVVLSPIFRKKPANNNNNKRCCLHVDQECIPLQPRGRGRGNRGTGASRGGCEGLRGRGARH